MTAWIKIIKNAEKLVENVDNVSRSKPLAAIRVLHKVDMPYAGSVKKVKKRDKSVFGKLLRYGYYDDEYFGEIFIDCVPKPLSSKRILYEVLSID